MLTGKGRGLVAKCDIKKGDLLLISQPLVFAAGPQGTIPELEELLQRYRATVSRRHGALLVIRPLFVPLAVFVMRAVSYDC